MAGKIKANLVPSGPMPPQPGQAAPDPLDREGSKVDAVHRHRAPLLWLVVPFLVGASLRRVGGEWPLPLPATSGAAMAILAFAASFGRTRLFHLLWAAGLCTATGLIGILFLGGANRRNSGSKPETLEIAVRVARIGAPHRSVRGGRWSAAGFGWEASTGEPIYFSLRIWPETILPIRGEEVTLRGKLKPVPPQGGPDTFNGYLRGSGIAHELVPADLIGVRRAPSAYARWRDALAEQMTAFLAVGFETRPDLAAIYRAMMLGRKDRLAAAQKQLFVRSGTMHLFAINGLHIGIVALALHSLLALLRTPPRLAAAAVVAVLWLDVDSTGASPSALRAFLMVGIVECAAALGLPMNPLAAITAAAAVMLAIDPTEAFGASFQMSFGVVAALILLGAPFTRHLAQRWDPWPLLPPATRTPWQRASAAVVRHAAGTLGFSAAAALVSAITGVTYFDVWAPVGLPANLLLMPLAALVIIAGFTSVLAGFAHLYSLTRLFNAAAGLLLRVIVRALQHLSGWPGACFTAHWRAPWIGPTALALLLSICLRGYAQDWREEHGGWWPPFLITAGAIILGVKFG